MRILRFFLILSLSFHLLFSQDNLPTAVFYYQSKKSDTDPRFQYYYELLKLSLEKTKEKYGPYQLKILPFQANNKRLKKLSLDGKFENFIFKYSVSQELMNQFEYASFPIDRGIVGYRVAFLSKKTKEKLNTVQSINDLKKFPILQGLGWLDTKILKANHFEVITGSDYKGLFSMVAKDYGELFFRGANELYQEWKLHKNIKNLTYDERIVLYYPLPRFFFTNKANKKAIKRIEEGLILAAKDGSFVDLWNEYYFDSINFVNLYKRKIFKIENPFLKGIDKEYEKYIYLP